jgi:hypothetical protein
LPPAEVGAPGIPAWDVVPPLPGNEGTFVSAPAPGSPPHAASDAATESETSPKTFSLMAIPCQCNAPPGGLARSIRNRFHEMPGQWSWSEPNDG